MNENSASSTLGALNATAILKTLGMASAGFQLSGTWVGTVSFEGTIDGTNWVSLMLTNPSTGAQSTSATSNGVYTGSVGGLTAIRAKMSAYTSGTAAVALRASIAGGGSGGGNVTEQNAPVYEDNANGKAVVEQRYTSTGVIAADLQIKSAPGFIHTITISCNDAAPTAGNLDIYDNTAASGTKLFSTSFTTTWFAPVTIVLDCVASTGIYADFTTTADVNVVVTYR